jgi:hypothetical protein
MDPKATVQALMDSVQKGDFAKARFLLSDDFQFSGPVPEPINGEAWMGMSMNLKKAFPDLDYHFHVDGADSNVVKLSAQLKGTHSGDLDLTALGMGVIPPTNKSFANPYEHGRVTVKGDKVASWSVDPIEGGGVMGILSQLGIKPPSM